MSHRTDGGFNHLQSGRRGRNERGCAAAQSAPNLRVLKRIELSRVSWKLNMSLVLIERRCPLEAPQSFIRVNGVISSMRPGKHSLSSLSALITWRPHAAPRAGTPRGSRPDPPGSGSGAEQSRVTLSLNGGLGSCHTAVMSLLISCRCKHSSHWSLEENAWYPAGLNTVCSVNPGRFPHGGLWNISLSNEEYSATSAGWLPNT